jgi:hypothetical protein
MPACFGGQLAAGLVGPSVAPSRRRGWPARRAVATNLTRLRASSHDHTTLINDCRRLPRPGTASAPVKFVGGSDPPDPLDTPDTFSGYRPQLYDGDGPSQLTRKHGRTHARCNDSKRTELAKTPPLFSLKCYLFSNIIECPKEPYRFECSV